jgi:hypothetical protein
MDCALAERGAIAIRAIMPKTVRRKPRIRIRNSSRPESYTQIVFVYRLLLYLAIRCGSLAVASHLAGNEMMY